MAIKKNAKAEPNKKDVAKKEKAKKVKEEVVEVEIEEEEVIEEVVSTNPEDYTFMVKLDRAKFPGRDAEQVDALIYGALGVNKKITIERE